MVRSQCNADATRWNVSSLHKRIGSVAQELTAVTAVGVLKSSRLKRDCSTGIFQSGETIGEIASKICHAVEDCAAVLRGCKRLRAKLWNVRNVQNEHQSMRFPRGRDVMNVNLWRKNDGKEIRRIFYGRGENQIKIMPKHPKKYEIKLNTQKSSILTAICSAYIVFWLSFR